VAVSSAGRTLRRRRMLRGLASGPSMKARARTASIEERGKGEAIVESETEAIGAIEEIGEIGVIGVIGIETTGVGTARIEAIEGREEIGVTAKTAVSVNTVESVIVAGDRVKTAWVRSRSVWRNRNRRRRRRRRRR
jgi:hypothetical protein